MGYIYLVTNLINNKRYVGQTTLTVSERWERHQYDALMKRDDFYFHKALRKYGIKNFSIEQIIECQNEELDDKECYYIDFYNTYYLHNKGYNLTRGGGGYKKVDANKVMELWNNGFSSTEISRQLGFYIRTITNILKRNGITQEEIYHRSHAYGARYFQKRIYQYDFDGNLINIFSNLNEMNKLTGYNKDYIAAVCCHRYTSANGYLWVYEDEEEDIKELLKRIPPALNHPVLQYNLKGELLREYISCGEAERQNNLSHGFISKVIRDNGLTAGGYIWIEKDSNTTVEEKIKRISQRYDDRKKKVAQFDLNNNFIKSYDSITAAARALGKESCRSAIAKVCNGQQKTSCGYIWHFVNDDELQ